MLFAAVVALTCAGAVSASTVPSLPKTVYYDVENAEKIFEDFINRYQKYYRTENERLERFEIFKQNLKELNEINSAHPYSLSEVTNFSDLTSDEMSKYFGYVPRNYSEIVKIDPYLPAGIIDLPASFDWREKNVVSPVKNQGGCCDCYIFSAIENIEGLYAIKHSTCLSLSTQQVLDCMPGTDCNMGGDPSNVMEYLAGGNPCEQESDYPYTGRKGSCAADKSKGVAVVQGGGVLNIPDEDTLAQTLVQTGPLSISIMAEGIRSYKAGEIWAASKCSGSVNHAVLLVGYGTEGNTPYWIIKNSWGTVFGDQGYMLLERGTQACGILSGVMSAQVA